MNEKIKRILAVVGVIVLLAAFCLPAFFAGGTGEGSQNRFMAAAAAAVFIPILVYICMMAVRVFGIRRASEGQMKNIVFDIGNVLMAFDWEGYLDSFGYSTGKREKIADAVFRSPVWNERDRGSLSEEEYLQAFINNAPEYEEEIREVMRRSTECIHLYPYSVTWLQYLQEKGYRTFILSNYSWYMLEGTQEKMKFLSHTDGVVFSCQEKLIKPEPEIYKVLLDRYHLKAEESVFIDDRPDNIETALALGMKGIVFKGFQEAAAELESLGVK